MAAEQEFVVHEEPVWRDRANFIVSTPTHGATVPEAMSAKEKLRERIETLSKEEAAETLRLLDQRTDSLSVLLDNAPLDDEPTTPEEEAAVQDALDAAGL